MCFVDRRPVLCLCASLWAGTSVVLLAVRDGLASQRSRDVADCISLLAICISVFCRRRGFSIQVKKYQTWQITMISLV